MPLDEIQLGRMMAMLEANGESLKQMQTSITGIYDRMNGLPCAEHCTALARIEEQAKASEKNENKTRWMLTLIIPALIAAGLSVLIGILR